MSEDVKNFLEELKEYSNGGVSGLYPPEETVKEFIEYSEQLQQQNEELKKQLEIKNDGFMASINETCEYATILEEFEKWLEENILKMKQSGKVMKSNIFITKDLEHTLSIIVLENVLDKLQELKEGSNEKSKDRTI